MFLVLTVFLMGVAVAIHLTTIFQMKTLTKDDLVSRYYLVTALVFTAFAFYSTATL